MTKESCDGRAPVAAPDPARDGLAQPRRRSSGRGWATQIGLGLWIAAGAAFGAEPAAKPNTNAITNTNLLSFLPDLPMHPVSLEDCIRLALEQNLDLKIERLNPPIARLDLELAKAGYDPLFTLTGNHSESEVGGVFVVTTNRPPGTTNILLSPNSLSKLDRFSSAVSGLGPYGLTYSLGGNAQDAYSLSGGQAGLTLTQPLLRNFLIDNTRFQIAVARNLVKVSEYQLRLQIINLLTAVEQAYYELIFARENVLVQAEGLRLAQRLADDDRKRVQIGMIPRLDEKQSESQVAARQADLSAAQRSLATAQNTLKRLITSEYRDLHDEQLDPTTKMGSEPHPMYVRGSWETGLAQRADLQAAKLDVERQGITLKYYKNQRLPQLDVSGTYGFGASGGDVREFSDVFHDIASADKPYWSVGATFSIPLWNKSARERYRQGKVTADQLVLQLKKIEETVLVEIDEAINGVRTTQEQVQSTAQARAYAVEALDAEQKKLDSGKSTSFVVLQLQRDLTSARSQEIRAVADYNKALAELYRAEGTTLDRRKITLQMK